MKNKMEVEAVDVMYTFGMESRFLPVKILKSFLLEGKQTWKKTKQASEGSVSIVVCFSLHFSVMISFQF